MNAENFAEWFRRQGHHVIHTASSYWYDAAPRVYQAFPYHWLIEPDDQELNELLIRNNAICLRYSCPIDAPIGKISYHIICEDRGYNLLPQPRKIRQAINKGLKFAPISIIPISRLATDGWELRKQTLSRQGRGKAETPKWWLNLCRSAQSLPGFEAWGAIHEGKLVSSFLAFRCEDCYTLLMQQSSTSYLQTGINNAIFFTVVNQALSYQGVSKIFIALQSLDAPASVDQFKFRMGFQAKPVRQRVVFNHRLSHILNPLTHGLLRGIVRAFPSYPAIAKMEGLLRFYLEGKKPLDKQVWPEIFIEQRETILSNSDE
jgi:hypothetical protein